MVEDKKKTKDQMLEELTEQRRLERESQPAWLKKMSNYHGTKHGGSQVESLSWRPGLEKKYGVLAVENGVDVLAIDNGDETLALENGDEILAIENGDEILAIENGPLAAEATGVLAIIRESSSNAEALYDTTQMPKRARILAELSISERASALSELEGWQFDAIVKSASYSEKVAISSAMAFKATLLAGMSGDEREMELSKMTAQEVQAVMDSQAFPEEKAAILSATAKRPEPEEPNSRHAKRREKQVKSALRNMETYMGFRQGAATREDLKKSGVSVQEWLDYYGGQEEDEDDDDLDFFT